VQENHLNVPTSAQWRFFRLLAKLYCGTIETSE